MLYDIVHLLCDNGRELVPAELVNALDTHVLGALKRDEEGTGDGFWASRYEAFVDRLRAKVVV